MSPERLWVIMGCLFRRVASCVDPLPRPLPWPLLSAEAFSQGGSGMGGVAQARRWRWNGWRRLAVEPAAAELYPGQHRKYVRGKQLHRRHRQHALGRRRQAAATPCGTNRRWRPTIGGRAISPTNFLSGRTAARCTTAGRALRTPARPRVAASVNLRLARRQPPAARTANNRMNGGTATVSSLGKVGTTTNAISFATEVKFAAPNQADSNAARFTGLVGAPRPEEPSDFASRWSEIQ